MFSHIDRLLGPKRKVSPIKLAILGTRGIPARYGGFETFAEKVSVGLSAQGIDVTVFCEATPGDLPDSYQGIHLKHVSVPPAGPLRTVVYDVKCLWLARKAYDVVYMLGYGAAPFCIIPRLWNTTVWINPDGLEWARAKWGFLAKTYFKLMEWFSLLSADRIIADAKAIEQVLSQRHGNLPACSVITYGCEVIDQAPPMTKLSKLDLTPGEYYIVVCRLEPENHAREILLAFQQSNSNKKLLVLGNHLSGTPYVETLKAIRDPRIHLIGTVYDHEELTALRYYSFAYLHGHSVGGTNPSLLEAMGCGNLVLAHDNIFNRETLGECGLYFADVAELTSHINRIEHTEAEVAQLREYSRSRARSDYHWDSIIEQYAALLYNTTR